MAVICDNTGVLVGTEICKLCVSHGCEGYKQAIKQDKQWEKLQKNRKGARNDLYRKESI